MLGDETTVTPSDYMDRIRALEAAGQGVRQALMPLVAGLDFGGGAVKACVADVATGEVVAMSRRTTPASRPGTGSSGVRTPGLVVDGGRSHARRSGAGRPAGQRLRCRDGCVASPGLCPAGCHRGAGPRGAELGPSRRRAQLRFGIRDIVGPDVLYATTGHWSAPQLTLPKLLEEQVADPERWDRTECLLFVHDWALWRLSGLRASEPSMASAGQLLDIRRREWARDLVTSVGLDPITAASPGRRERPRRAPGRVPRTATRDPRGGRRGRHPAAAAGGGRPRR